MTTTQISRKKFRAGTALRALALLGAGVTISAGLAAPAAAQDFQNINATGRVVGPNGAGISNATVSIVSDEQGFTRSVTTTASGAFRISQIPAGDYTFTVSAPGFQTYNESGVPLTRSGAANQFTLISDEAGASAPAGGEIVVQGTRVQTADFEQTTTGAVVNVADIANRVPVARNLNSIVQLTPGASEGDSAFGNQPSLNGASVGENQFFVNGLNITNFRTLYGSNTVPFEFYDTVEVKDGGYPAEYGRSTGGFISATTKSGSNEFHAGMVATWEPNELRNKSPNTATADNDYDYDEDFRTDFYISGPIIKDHLFFYGLYEQRYVKNGDGGTLDRNPYYNISRDESPFFAGKIDAVIVDGQRLEFTYFRTTSTTNNSIFDYNSDTNEIGASEGTYLREFGGDNFVGRYTGNFTDWLTVSAAYGRSNDRDNTFSSTPDLPYVVDNRGGAPQSLANYVNVESANEDKREFYRGDVDLYFSLLGNHHIRFGYDRENLKTEGNTHYTGDYAYQVFHSGSLGDYVRTRQFIGGGTFKTRNEAYYAEDNWSLFNDRLQLSLGVRNDHFENKNIEGETYYKSGDQWGPRLGATFDLFGDGRSKIYGNFGRYFLPIAANTNIRLGGQEYDVYSYYQFDGFDENNVPIRGTPLVIGTCVNPDPFYGVTTNCAVNHDGTVSSTASTVSENLEPQSVDQYILGYEQKIGEHWTVGLYGTYSSLNNSLEDSAIDGAARQYCRDQGFPDDPGVGTAAGEDPTILGCNEIYAGFSQYVLNNPGNDITTQITLPDGTTPTVTLSDIGYPHAKRVYEAVTFKVDREYDGIWSLGGSYTYSKTIGNIEGSVTSDNGQTDAGLTQDFDQPELTYGSYGYLPNDRRHNIKLYGGYKVFDWLNLGANLNVSSPRHFGCFGLLPDNLSELAPVINQNYGAASRYCPYADGDLGVVQNPDGSFSSTNPIVQVRRGTGFDTDWTTSLNLQAAITIPTDAFDGVLRFDVFNVFNSKAVIDANEFGTDDSGVVRTDYRQPTSYQAPRSGRVQLQLRF